MAYSEDLFDDAVFGGISAPRSARASVVQNSGETFNPEAPERQRMDLDALVTLSGLSFSSLMAADKTARVHAVPRGYRIELGSARFAFDMGAFRDLLSGDNEGVDLSFSDELASYTPEEGLVRKTKIPLWVLRPVGSKTVLIQRIW